MLSAIDIMDIQESNGEIEREYLYTDKQYAVVPNVVGLNVKSATKLLKKFKVEYSGTGDIVTYQSPSENTKIYEGETIRLLLN